MPPDLALLLTFSGSNYPCLELVFMVPKVFEPLKFDCINIYFCTSVAAFTTSMSDLNAAVALHNTVSLTL